MPYSKHNAAVLGEVYARAVRTHFPGVRDLNTPEMKRVLDFGMELASEAFHAGIEIGRTRGRRKKPTR